MAYDTANTTENDMPAQQEARLGLYFGWDSGESGMKNQLDANVNKLGALTQLSVKSRVLTSAPGSPANGDTYIIATGATGVWASKDANVAVYRSSLAAWEFYAPRVGYLAFIEAEDKLSVYKSGGWSAGISI